MQRTTKIERYPAESLSAAVASTKSFAPGLCVAQASAAARFFLALLLICTLSLGSISFGLTQPSRAFAATTETEAEPSESQQTIETTAAAYDEAVSRVAQIEQQITDNETNISQLEADLPEQQERGASSMRVLYKLQQESQGLINLILNAENLSDLFVTVEYIDQIQQRNLSEIERLQSMKTELTTTQDQLVEAKGAAITEQANAESALAAAQAAREEAQRKAQQQAEAEARKAEQAAAEKQKQAEAAAATQKETAKEENAPSKETPSESTPNPVAPSTPEAVDPPPSDVNWGSDKAAFVAEWSGRIDAYLAGSPLSGQGKTFAEAAWDYGVDPRWSPAIANTESSKGAACFQPHNAWGWGSISWGSWEEAINAHVGGLARGYGYTISVDAAKKYCPPNWQHWYDVTLAQMNMI